MRIDTASVFLWMTALLVYGRPVDDEVQLGDLIWRVLRYECDPSMPARPSA